MNGRKTKTRERKIEGNKLEPSAPSPMFGSSHSFECDLRTDLQLFRAYHLTAFYLARDPAPNTPMVSNLSLAKELSARQLPDVFIQKKKQPIKTASGTDPQAKESTLEPLFPRCVQKGEEIYAVLLLHL